MGKSFDIGKIKAAAKGIVDKKVVLEMTETGPKIKVLCGNCERLLLTIPITQDCSKCDTILQKYSDVENMLAEDSTQVGKVSGNEENK
jgi:hypothetical protein